MINYQYEKHTITNTISELNSTISYKFYFFRLQGKRTSFKRNSLTHPYICLNNGKYQRNS